MEVPFSPKDKMGTRSDPVSIAILMNPCLFFRTSSMTPGLACNDSSAPPTTIVIALPGQFALTLTTFKRDSTVELHSYDYLHWLVPKLEYTPCTAVTEIAHLM